MNIYSIQNPFYNTDTFVFAEVDEIGWCYVKLNRNSEIDEIGYDISHRLHDKDIDEIIRESREPERIQEYRFKGISEHFWMKTKEHHIRVYGHDTMR